MSNRRVPLANVPNAANSPFRAVAAAASKRRRSYSNIGGEAPYGQPPPAKKQIVEADEPAPRTPSRKQRVPIAEGRVFNKKSTISQPTAFDRKLLAAKDIQSKVTTQEKVIAENYETIKQWQKHYRKVFPSFIFYFESVPEDVRVKCSRQLGGLGAREEKFFSRDVTHIITTRLIPTSSESSTPTDIIGASSTTTGSYENSQPRTINPSLLEKTSDSHVNSVPSNRFSFDAPTSRKLQPGGFQDDSRKQHAANTDILHKAREMGMKIWQLEKLQRMMRVMYETEWESPYQHGHNTRSNVANSVVTAKPGREADLSHLLRNEQLNGASDRDSTLASSELIPFKGPHIYIRDMNEKTKPIMFREYARVQRREEGAWPQFRSVSHGKCPFIEEAIHSRKDIEKEKSREQDRLAQAKAEYKAVPQGRTVASLESTRMHPPLHVTRKRPLADLKNGINLMAQPVQQLPVDEPCEPPPPIGSKLAEPPLRHLPIGIGSRLHGGEPIASGVQPSNITSAIRSQMISSTAAVPGAKAGTSREVYELKRKVLERNSGPSLNSVSSTQRSIDHAGNTRAERGATTARLAKIKAQEKLGKQPLAHIEEEFTPSEEEEIARRVALGTSNAWKVKVGEKKDLKPGYCENCREKFDDFEEHTIGRRHRKFAITQDNWKELDSLLKQLVRPLREDNVDVL